MARFHSGYPAINPLCAHARHIAILCCYSIAPDTTEDNSASAPLPHAHTAQAQQDSSPLMLETPQIPFQRTGTSGILRDPNPGDGTSRTGGGATTERSERTVKFAGLDPDSESCDACEGWMPSWQNGPSGAPPSPHECEDMNCTHFELQVFNYTIVNGYCHSNPLCVRAHLKAALGDPYGGS
jgi:hypothetical protein